MAARPPQDDPFRFGRRRLTVGIAPEGRDVRLPFVEIDHDDERVYVTIEFYDGTEAVATVRVEPKRLVIEKLPTVLGSHDVALPVEVDPEGAEETRRNAVVTLLLPRRGPEDKVE